MIRSSKLPDADVAVTSNKNPSRGSQGGNFRGRELKSFALRELKREFKTESSSRGETDSSLSFYENRTSAPATRFSSRSLACLRRIESLMPRARTLTKGNEDASASREPNFPIDRSSGS